MLKSQWSFANEIPVDATPWFLLFTWAEGEREEGEGGRGRGRKREIESEREEREEREIERHRGVHFRVSLCVEACLHLCSFGPCSLFDLGCWVEAQIQPNPRIRSPEPLAEPLILHICYGALLNPNRPLLNPPLVREPPASRSPTNNQKELF